MSELSKVVSLPAVRLHANYFVICNACLWCATDLSGGTRVTRCPACTDVEQPVESIPLGSAEKCKIAYDDRRGVTLEFFTQRRAMFYNTT